MGDVSLCHMPLLFAYLGQNVSAPGRNPRGVHIDPHTQSQYCSPFPARAPFIAHLKFVLFKNIRPPRRFGFDLIYGGDSEQISLWKDVGVPALEKAFAG